MADKYKVAVHGLMKKNGQMAKFGDELTDDIHIDDAAKKVKQGYLLPSDEFDAARKKEADELEELKRTPEEKAQILADAAKKKSEKEAAEKKKAEDLAVSNDLLSKYNTLFKQDAPENATNEEIADAIKTKTSIVVA